jgi:hypothetical protein
LFPFIFSGGNAATYFRHVVFLTKIAVVIPKKSKKEAVWSFDNLRMSGARLRIQDQKLVLSLIFEN